MKGRTQFDLPNKNSVRKVFHDTMRQKNNKLLNEFARSENRQAGQIQISGLRTKDRHFEEKTGDADPLNNYVNNFSEMADLLDNHESPEASRKKLTGFTSGLK